MAAGEHVVILGAGPIGQALALAASDLGASALLVDGSTVARLAHGADARFGADTLHVDPEADLTAVAASGRAGTGRRSCSSRSVRSGAGPAVDLGDSHGRVVVVELSGETAPVRVGDLPLQGDRPGFRDELRGRQLAGAVELVRRRRDAVSGLVPRLRTLEHAPEAIASRWGDPAGDEGARPGRRAVIAADRALSLRFPDPSRRR